MTVNERIAKLRKLMAEKNIDFYMIPSEDFHQSEYVGDYFKSREYITGFTGSAGTALITKDEALFWTDGRYFLQAEIQLKGSEVKLMKTGEKGVATIVEYVKSNIKEGQNVGFDGRVVPAVQGEVFELLLKKDCKIIYDYDLVNEIWQDRAPLSDKKVFALDLKYCGEDTRSKLLKIREEMKQKGATYHILTTLDDISYILNVRGDDVAYCPVVLSYAVITMDKVSLYTDKTKFSDEIVKNLQDCGIEFKEYNQIYENVKKISSDEVILLDKTKINYALFCNIDKNIKKIDSLNPSSVLKSMKNKTEIENQRKAQLFDAVAHVKFMKYLKENVGKLKISEVDASDKLDEFRKQNQSYIMPSFSPISAFGRNGAIIHYSADKDNCAFLEKGSLFMTDTGAHYFEGTTDITRTYALGDVSDEIKEHFTIVAISNLSLASAKFMYGMSGSNLDILARKPFWDRGLNYNHGTGHGVGYILNVHEGPMSLRWQQEKMGLYKLEEGMIITDEPGMYVANSHGIRLENELLVVKDEQNAYGDFMSFEVMTFVPFDLDAIKVDIMSEEERQILNDYHKKVYEKVSPHLNDEEKKWLEYYTRKI